MPNLERMTQAALGAMINALDLVPEDRVLIIGDASAGACPKAFAKAADAYIGYTLEHLVDAKGFLWWGWHRHYDVFTDEMTGHSGNHHEIHAIHDIYWDRLWAVDPNATRKEIEACWTWHVIDKKTGEINRHRAFYIYDRSIPVGFLRGQDLNTEEGVLTRSGELPESVEGRMDRSVTGRGLRTGID